MVKKTPNFCSLALYYIFFSDFESLQLDSNGLKIKILKNHVVKVQKPAVFRPQNTQIKNLRIFLKTYFPSYGTRLLISNIPILLERIGSAKSENNLFLVKNGF